MPRATIFPANGLLTSTVQYHRLALPSLLPSASIMLTTNAAALAACEVTTTKTRVITSPTRSTPCTGKQTDYDLLKRFRADDVSAVAPVAKRKKCFAIPERIPDTFRKRTLAGRRL